MLVPPETISRVAPTAADATARTPIASAHQIIALRLMRELVITPSRFTMIFF